MHRLNPVSTRILSLALALLLLCSACGGGRTGGSHSGQSGGSDVTSTMRLVQTEGTVSLSDDTGRSLSPRPNALLYSGYQVATSPASYAWIDLDSTKLTKLDQSSQVEIQKTNNDLALFVRAGSLFFNITQPLADDETLSICTSTILLDIRDACGWVSAESDRHMTVSLLEGSLECSITEPSGVVTFTTICAGETAELSFDSGGTPQIAVGTVSPSDVPDFVFAELEGDDALLQDILADSGLDLSGGGGFDPAGLASVAYCGDLSQCAMTAEQAAAFAQVLEDCLDEMGSLRGSFDSYPPFCRAALFDAGDGIPALWVVLGNHIYDDAYGYMASVNRIYQWDGRQAVLAVGDEADTTILLEQGLLLDHFWPEWFANSYNYSCLYPLSNGCIGSTPEHVYETFTLFLYEGDLPTVDELRQQIYQFSQSGVRYDYRTFSPDLWQDIEWADGWTIAAIDGTFLAPLPAHDSGQLLYWGSGNQLLGQGQGGHTDVDQAWYGDWSDGADMLAALTGRGSAGQARLHPVATYDPNTYIKHLELDPRGYPIQIFCEYPVFPETGPAYQTINRALQEVGDAFYAPDNGTAAFIWGLREEAIETGQTFFATVTAHIATYTDQLVSVAFEETLHSGGAHPMFASWYRTFRVDTGAELRITDLVEGTDDEILEKIAAALAESSDAFDASVRSSVLQYNLEDIPFYVQDGHVWVSFSPGVLSYWAAGSFTAELSAPLKPLR